MRRVLVPLAISTMARGGFPGFQLHSLEGRTMGTGWSVKLAAPASIEMRDVLRRIEETLVVVVDQMSGWLPESNLCRFNRAPAGTWVPLPEEFFAVLDCAMELAEDTGGAFDPTLGEAVALWGFGAEPAVAEPPSDAAIAGARSRSGWRRLELDRRSCRARKSAEVRLDLSGIAKGFAVDLVCESLRALGLSDFLVEIGGELRGEGVKPDGQPWWVTLERPPATPDARARSEEQTDIVALHGLAVATSGDYRRFVEVAGTRYSHTIDPRTGCPIANGLASVTVLHASCMQADALATAMTVLGPREAIVYARRRGVAARLIGRSSAGLEEEITPAFAAMLA